MWAGVGLRHVVTSSCLVPDSRRWVVYRPSRPVPQGMRPVAHGCTQTARATEFRRAIRARLTRVCPTVAQGENRSESDSGASRPRTTRARPDYPVAAAQVQAAICRGHQPWRRDEPGRRRRGRRVLSGRRAHADRARAARWPVSSRSRPRNRSTPSRRWPSGRSTAVCPSSSGSTCRPGRSKSRNGSAPTTTSA